MILATALAQTRDVSSELGVSFVNADVAADFLRVRLAEIKAEAASISPGDPDRVEINVVGVSVSQDVVSKTTGKLIRVEEFISTAVQGEINVSEAETRDFREAVNTVSDAILMKGISRVRLVELNAFPSLTGAPVGELVPRLENLLRIYDITVRGVRPDVARPSALPLAGGIVIAFLVVGAGIYLWLRRKS